MKKLLLILFLFCTITHANPVFVSCSVMRAISEQKKWELISGTPWPEFDFQWCIVFNYPQDSFITKTVLQQKTVKRFLKNNRYTLKKER